jgi:hypothetical protein
VLCETMSRGLCRLVCPSRTSERGGEGECVKEGGGEEGERGARGSVHWGCDYSTSLNIEVDPSPQRRRFGRRRKSDLLFITAVPNVKLFWRVCLLLHRVPITKLFAWGEGDSGGHVCM